jgi:hypothetical protein
MGMSQMRGELADAIRQTHVPNVKKILDGYCRRDDKEYWETRIDKKLKSAELLAKMVVRKSQEIVAAIQEVRESRANAKEKRA